LISEYNPSLPVFPLPPPGISSAPPASSMPGLSSHPSLGMQSNYDLSHQMAFFNPSASPFGHGLPPPQSPHHMSPFAPPSAHGMMPVSHLGPNSQAMQAMSQARSSNELQSQIALAMRQQQQYEMERAMKQQQQFEIEKALLYKHYMDQQKNYYARLY